MLRYFAVFLTVLFMLPLASPAFADDNGVIGTVLEVEGNASVTPAGGQAAAAAVDMPVHLNDTVLTGAASRVFILFIDNTQLTLSESTQVKIDSYVYDPDDKSNNKAAYSVMEGAFQYVSGLIGKRDNPDVHIDTPVGSIGIRGTDFWAGNLDNQYSVAVNDGKVALKTDAGEEVVNKGQGTSVHDRHSVPSHAQTWSREKFERTKSTVHLKRQDLVQRKIKTMQGRQNILRRRYKNYMTRHGASSGRQRQQVQGDRHEQLNNKKQQQFKSWCQHHPKRCAQKKKAEEKE